MVVNNTAGDVKNRSSRGGVQNLEIVGVLIHAHVSIDRELEIIAGLNRRSDSNIEREIERHLDIVKVLMLNEITVHKVDRQRSDGGLQLSLGQHK